VRTIFLCLGLMLPGLAANAFSEEQLKTPRLEQAAMCGALSARMVEIEEQYAQLGLSMNQPPPKADLLVWITARDLLFKSGFVLVDEGALSAGDMAKAMDSRLSIVDILDTRQRNLVLEQCHQLRLNVVLGDANAIPKAMANVYADVFKRSLAEDAQQKPPTFELLSSFSKTERSPICLRSATRVMETLETMKPPLEAQTSFLLSRSVVLFGRMVWLNSDAKGELSLTEDVLAQADGRLESWTPDERETVFNECYAFSGTLEEIPVMLDEDFKSYAVRLFKEKTAKN
jgi:hypothetical protein